MHLEQASPVFRYGYQYPPLPLETSNVRTVTGLFVWFFTAFIFICSRQFVPTSFADPICLSRIQAVYPGSRVNIK
jgi:hypothetical protein